ncbi:hypothetical protein AB9F29_17260 [Falsihalocynthiibacter sp. S25ZX9]|uniref:hypothetical protein n=1 Tax=Falsihalocynthiibacter sp. S25ZX9 TaxID=3240870 RepID=UPI00350F91DF
MRQLLKILVPILTILAAPVASQEILYELVDTGILTDPERGQGIEMRVKPSGVPNDGFFGESNQLALPTVCKHYAPSVIPFIADKFGLTEPEFIAVRLVSGSSIFGKYILEFYAIQNGTCGDEL